MATVKKSRPASAKKVVAGKSAAKKTVAKKPTVKKAPSKPVAPAKKPVAKPIVKSKPAAVVKKVTAKPVAKSVSNPTKPIAQKVIAKPASVVKKSTPSTSAKANPVIDKNKKVVSAKPGEKSTSVKKIIEKKGSAKPVVEPAKNVSKVSPKAAEAPKKNPATKVISKAPEPAVKNIPVKSSDKAKLTKPADTSPKKSDEKNIPVKSSDKAKLSTPVVSPPKKTIEKNNSGKKTDAPVAKSSAKDDDKLDPLHVKAQKAMRELEETMDLSKVRPRIQATTSIPEPKIHRVTHPPLKLIEPTNTTKIKYQLEFDFRSSPKILFNALSDASGLAGWFADEVKTKDNIYTFVWEGGESYAKLVGIKDLQLVRFQWLDDTDGTYFQFEIKEDDITTDVALVLTDFANPGEKDTNIRLWESQVQKLRMLLGSL